MGTILWAKSGGQSPDVCDKTGGRGPGVAGAEGTIELHFPAGCRVQVPPALELFLLGTDGFCSSSSCNPGVVGNRTEGFGAGAGI